MSLTAEGGERGVNHENKRSVFGKAEVENYSVKMTMTEPRTRKPLQARDPNQTQNGTPGRTCSSLKLAKSKSAPQPTKSQQIPISEEVELHEEPSSKLKRPKIETANVVTLKKLETEWVSSDDLHGAIALSERIGVNIPVEEQIDGYLSLFKYMETNRELGPKALRVYAACPQIQSVMMTPSYGSEINEIGLLKGGPFSAIGCTRPFFGGYANLLVLDLTCVPIVDDDIRYLIKLSKLQALGLSGTKVSAKGLRYLVKYAQFSKSLRCLKLCCMELFDDQAMSELVGFSGLQELDLVGNQRITLRGLLKFIGDFAEKCPLKRLRLPTKISDGLRDRHLIYRELGGQNTDLIQDIGQLDAHGNKIELKRQLKLHQKTYPDIFLNLEAISMREKLQSTLIMRKREEFLYSICL